MKASNGMKYCPRCTETKAVADFAASYGNDDGLQTWCRNCCNLYNRQRSKVRRAANRAKHLGEKAGE
jgi:hypothetical protein